MSDVIDRQAAIELIERMKPYHQDSDDIAEMIANMPSVQPNTDEWCTDCKEYDHDRHCCPRWNRVIRETLKDAQAEIIRCRDCRWWGYDGDDGPVRVCHAAKHGHMSSHWNIQIYRTYRENFYCADAERREDEQTD